MVLVGCHSVGNSRTRCSSLSGYLVLRARPKSRDNISCQHANKPSFDSVAEALEDSYWESNMMLPAMGHMAIWRPRLGTWLAAALQGTHLAVGPNPVALVNIKIGGKWMFIHPKMARHRLCPHGHLQSSPSMLPTLIRLRLLRKWVKIKPPGRRF